MAAQSTWRRLTIGERSRRIAGLLPRPRDHDGRFRTNIRLARFSRRHWRRARTGRGRAKNDSLLELRRDDAGRALCVADTNASMKPVLSTVYSPAQLDLFLRIEDAITTNKFAMDAFLLVPIVLSLRFLFRKRDVCSLDRPRCIPPSS